MLTIVSRNVDFAKIAKAMILMTRCASIARTDFMAVPEFARK